MKFLGALIGLLLGGGVGFFGMYALILLYVSAGGDETAAQSFSSLTRFTVPIAAIGGGLLGYFYLRNGKSGDRD